MERGGRKGAHARKHHSMAKLQIYIILMTV